MRTCQGSCVHGKRRGAQHGARLRITEPGTERGGEVSVVTSSVIKPVAFASSYTLCALPSSFRRHACFMSALSAARSTQAGLRTANARSRVSARPAAWSRGGARTHTLAWPRRHRARRRPSRPRQLPRHPLWWAAAWRPWHLRARAEAFVTSPARELPRTHVAGKAGSRSCGGASHILRSTVMAVQICWWPIGCARRNTQHV